MKNLIRLGELEGQKKKLEKARGLVECVENSEFILLQINQLISLIDEQILAFNIIFKSKESGNIKE